MKYRHKHLFLILFACISCFFALLIFVPAATKGLVNQLLSSSKVRLECLEYRVTLPLTVQLERLCVTMPDAHIQAREGQWHILDNLFVLSALDIDVQPTTQPKNQQITEKQSTEKSDFSLPKPPSFLPYLEIHSLKVQLPTFENTIEFSLSHHQPNEFVLKEDWQAIVHITDQGLVAKAEWQLGDAVAFVRPVAPSPPWDKLDTKQLQVPIRSDITILGSALTSSHSTTLNQIIELNGCQLALSGGGKVGFNIDLNALSGDISLKDFPISSTFSACSELQQLPKILRPEVLSIAVERPIRFTQESVSIPRVELELGGESLTELDIAQVTWGFDQQAQGQFHWVTQHEPGIAISAAGDFHLKDGKFSLEMNDGKFKVDQLKLEDMQIEDANGKFTISLSDMNAVNGQIDLQLGKARHDETKTHLNQLTAQAVLSGTIQELEIDLTQNTNKLEIEALTASNVEQHYQLNIAQLQQVSVSAQSQIGSLKYDDLSAGTVNATHEAKFKTDFSNLSSNHQLELLDGFTLEANISDKQAEVKIPPQTLTSFNNLIKQRQPDLSVADGTLSGQFNIDLATLQGKGRAQITDLEASYTDYQLTGLTYSPRFAIDSAGFQVLPSNLHVTEIDTGITIADLNMTIEAKDSQPQATDISASLLGGQFHIPEMKLSNVDQLIQLKLSDIELSALMALQGQSGLGNDGIEVSGRLQGDIPVQIKDTKISIDNAELKNSGSGYLLITGNQAFEAIKQQQPQISAQLALLENLEFDTLSADATLAVDGQLFLDVAIKGTNPEQQQPIDFNYTHEQNLNLLLKSLRISDEIEKKVESELLSTPD